MMALLPQEINPEAAAHTKQRINVEISRTEGDVVLRDDPEAKAAFLSTFTSEEEKAIMHKVNKRFFVLIGLMYMIKQVCNSVDHRLKGLKLILVDRRYQRC